MSGGRLRPHDGRSGARATLRRGDGHGDPRVVGRQAGGREEERGGGEEGSARRLAMGTRAASAGPRRRGRAGRLRHTGDPFQVDGEGGVWSWWYVPGACEINPGCKRPATAGAQPPNHPGIGEGPSCLDAHEHESRTQSHCLPEIPRGTLQLGPGQAAWWWCGAAIAPQHVVRLPV